MRGSAEGLDQARRPRRHQPDKERPMSNSVFVLRLTHEVFVHVIGREIASDSGKEIHIGFTDGLGKLNLVAHAHEEVVCLHAHDTSSGAKTTLSRMSPVTSFEENPASARIERESAPGATAKRRTGGTS